MSRRALALAFILLGIASGAALAWKWLTYPSDRTPEGAYLRIVSAVNRDRPEEFFAYTETRAQHACFTIGDYRRRARARVLEAYPEPERTHVARGYSVVADAERGEGVFGTYARDHGWLVSLRRDLSGVARVDIQGERATIHTARGTRYSFRRRENGIWGLTSFTATLVNEEEKAARDLEAVEAAARDYERASERIEP